MRYTLENEFLDVQAESLGAELVSVVDKATGAEMLWHGDPKVWPRQAPILFPYCTSFWACRQRDALLPALQRRHAGALSPRI